MTTYTRYVFGVYSKVPSENHIKQKNNTKNIANTQVQQAVRSNVGADGLMWCTYNMLVLVQASHVARTYQSWAAVGAI